jgi:biotin carboxyl carrier protein
VKFTVEAGGSTFELELGQPGTSVQYKVAGAKEVSGEASLVPVSPGVYSVLLGTNSITVNLSKSEGRYDAASGGRRVFLGIADKRDRAERERPDAGSGPVEVRAQMPGKIISLLVQPGAEVAAGQSLLVIEAMKMQNELKSPKSGIVSKLHVSEGETVPANHRLVVIE